MRKKGLIDWLRGAIVWSGVCLVRLLFLALVLSVVLCPTAGLVSTQEEADEALIPPLMSASVHDPSIIKAGDTYYVFGSHLAAAKSMDLRDWRSIESACTTPTG